MNRSRRRDKKCFQLMIRQILKKQKKINRLELKIVSFDVTIETKAKMRDKISFDLDGSESHVSAGFLHQMRDHQDTINSHNEDVDFNDFDTASSAASGHTTSWLTDRTPVAMETISGRDPNTPSCFDHQAEGKTIATLVQSNTVLSCLKGDVSPSFKISMATYTTPHLEASPVASTAAAIINIPSEEPSSRDPHAENSPMPFAGYAVLILLRTLPQTTLRAQSASTLYPPLPKEKG